MTSTVYFADMRAGHKENLFAKIGRLMASCGIRERVAPGDLVAIKVHFGERGNHAFIRPIFIRRVVDEIKGCGGRPFLTDSSTLYPGERKEGVSALVNAIENGFTSQFTNSVTSKPFGRFAIPPIAPKSTLSIIG